MQSDGELSCSPGSAQGLLDGSEELKNAGIRFFDSKKGFDGKMHPQMCGVYTGSVNEYLIRRSDLAKALKLGFQEVAKGAAR